MSISTENVFSAPSVINNEAAKNMRIELCCEMLVPIRDKVV